MKIVNFAGSFDPIHNGHLEMIKQAFNDIQPDLFYVTPIFRSFTKTYSTTYNDRAHMIELALKTLHNDKIKINYCEQDIPEGYSGYKHINDLKNYTHAEELYIVIGADHLADLSTWDEIDWLVKNVKFYVFARRNLPINPFAQKLIDEGRMIFNYNFDFEVGSYAQRVVPSFLNDDVINYINENGLYAFQRLQSKLRNNRIAHSMRVAQLCKEYANIYDPKLVKQAYVAGLFHDWCKESSDEMIKIWMQLSPYKQFSNMFTRINNLHGPAAAVVLQTQLFFKDELVLHAIANHTYQFDSKTTLLDKILYCADKLEPGRTEEDLANIEHYRQLAKTNLDQAYQEIMQYQKAKFSHLLNK